MHGLGAMDNGTPSVNGRTAFAHWSLQIFYHTATFPWGSGQQKSCGKLLHRLKAMGSGTLTVVCRPTSGKGARQLQFSKALLWGSGQWNSFGTLLQCPGAAGITNCAVHCLGVVGSGVCSLHFRTAVGHWVLSPSW